MFLCTCLLWVLKDGGWNKAREEWMGFWMGMGAKIGLCQGWPRSTISTQVHASKIADADPRRLLGAVEACPGVREQMSLGQDLTLVGCSTHSVGVVALVEQSDPNWIGQSDSSQVLNIFCLLLHDSYW